MVVVKGVVVVRIFKFVYKQKIKRGLSFNLFCIPCIFRFTNNGHIIWDMIAFYSAGPFLNYISLISGHQSCCFVRSFHKVPSKIASKFRCGRVLFLITVFHNSRKKHVLSWLCNIVFLIVLKLLLTSKINVLLWKAGNLYSILRFLVVKQEPHYIYWLQNKSYFKLLF